MKNKGSYFLIFTLLMPVLLWAKATVSEVEKNLMCTCGCSMALYTCECGTAEKMRNNIQGMIDKGMDKDGIIAAYVGQFGESILSAPTKKGFNLSAWIMPFLAIGLAGGLLYKTLRRWSSHQTTVEIEIDKKIEPGYEQRLRDELADFEEGEVS